jgi:hypothetical protein
VVEVVLAGQVGVDGVGCFKQPFVPVVALRVEDEPEPFPGSPVFKDEALLSSALYEFGCLFRQLLLSPDDSPRKGRASLLECCRSLSCTCLMAEQAEEIQSES